MCQHKNIINLYLQFKTVSNNGVSVPIGILLSLVTLFRFLAPPFRWEFRFRSESFSILVESMK